MKSLGHAVVAIVLLAGIAHADDIPDYSGKWLGKCYDCRAHDFHLVLEQSGSVVTGTLRITKTRWFGDEINPVENGIADKKRVKFEVPGRHSGLVLYASLKLKKNGQQLTGRGRIPPGPWRRFRLIFNRVGQ